MKTPIRHQTAQRHLNQLGDTAYKQEPDEAVYYDALVTKLITTASHLISENNSAAVLNELTEIIELAETLAKHLGYSHQHIRGVLRAKRDQDGDYTQRWIHDTEHLGSK